MQKIDIYQPLILSYLEQTSAFWENNEQAKWLLDNAWDLNHYKSANIQLIWASIRPYQVNKQEEKIEYSDAQLAQQRKAYERLRNEQWIFAITEKTQLEDTKYVDYRLNILYHLTGCDGIQTIQDLEKLHKGWIRSMQLVREYDNALAHCHRNNTKEWLTDLGKQAVQRMDEHNVIIDTANMNYQSMMDVYTFNKKPIINSHTNIQTLFNYSRNVTDDFLDIIGDSYGLIGLSLESACMSESDEWATIDTYLKHIKYVRDRIGDDHIAFGSGYHGMYHKRVITGYEKIKSVATIEQKMIEAFGQKFTQKFFRENAYRIMMQVL